MNLTMIVAVSENNMIGKNNDLPWPRIKADMQRFAQLTTPHPVIMGRKTYDSIPPKFRPLKDRKNIILSTTYPQAEGIYVARTIDEALALTEGKDAFIAGGHEVYKAFLPYSNRIELTRIRGIYEGDVSFPQVDWGEWDMVKEEQHLGEKIPYSFVSFVRRK